MIGIKSGTLALGAEKFPDRKLPSLVIQRGNEGKIIGHFNRAESVVEFYGALLEILQGLSEDNKEK